MCLHFTHPEPNLLQRKINPYTTCLLNDYLINQIIFHWCHTIEQQAEKVSKIGQQLIKAISQNIQESLELHQGYSEILLDPAI